MGYKKVQIHLDAVLNEQLRYYSQTNMVDENTVINTALRQYLEAAQPRSSELASGYKEMGPLNRAIAADYAATEEDDERGLI
ncbi:hypothetical protein [Schleiferilactobacillus shenzhenensis]|nr:hypothetical protein [Schleiferilactobacillus shenzhenensis]